MTDKITKDFFLEVAKGNIPRHTAVQKFGRNADIDTAAEEDIWAGGGARAYLSAAETMDIASTSTNDDGDPAGTGVRTVMIQGLDADYKEIEETVTPNGTSTVTTTKSYLRVHRMFVATAGSVETNDGDITADPTSSGSGSRQAFIAAGDGQTLISHYTIPADRTAYMVGGQAGVASSSGAGSKEARLRLFMKPFGGAWRLQQEVDLKNEGTSTTPDFIFTIPMAITEKTDLKWTAAVDANNTSVYLQYNLILVNN